MKIMYGTLKIGFQLKVLRKNTSYPWREGRTASYRTNNPIEQALSNAMSRGVSVADRSERHACMALVASVVTFVSRKLF